MSMFWSPNGSSASFVSLKPWNHHLVSVVRRRPTTDEVPLGAILTHSASITVVRYMITITMAIGITATTTFAFASAGIDRGNPGRDAVLQVPEGEQAARGGAVAERLMGGRQADAA